MMDIAERTRIGSAIEEAAELLPEKWDITITIYRGSVSVELVDDDGDSLEFPSNRETLSDEIRDAVECAVEQAKGEAK